MASGPVPDRRRRLVSAGAPLVLATALLAPVVSLILFGVSPVGMTEESTGYRYFYSLRILYTADERPWLPQGQVMTLLHIVLQALISLAGYPVTQLTPRMEVFAYLGAGIPSVCTAIAALWALRPLRTVLAQLAVVALLVSAVFNWSLSIGYHLVVPDYHPWIHVVTMVAIGCTLRLAAHPEAPSRRWILGLGVFAGLAISLKVTLIVLAGPPILLALARVRTWRAMVAAIIVIGMISLGLFLSLTWLSYGADGAATLRYFALLFGFAGAVGEAVQMPLPTWWVRQFTGEASAWTTKLSALMPLVLALSAALLRPRLVSLALLPSSVMSLLLLWKRDETTTFIEVMGCALLALVVWAACVAGPALRQVYLNGTLAQRLRPEWGRPLYALASGALVALTVLVAARGVQLILPPFTETDAAQRALDRFVTDPPGRVAILTLDNLHRPLSRDSAIFKGGTNVAGSNLWGASPFVASLVPERHYFFPSPDLGTPIDLSPFQYVLFVSTEPPELTRAKLAEAFGASLGGFECPLLLNVSGAAQHGCRQVPRVPIGASHGEIGFVSTPTVLTDGRSVGWPAEAARPLAEGEAAFVAATREIWRREPAGRFVRLQGDPGQTVRISSLGAWSKGRKQTAGMLARYDDARWIVDDERPRPINRNPTLRMQGDGTIRGWDLLSRERVSVDRRQESVEVVAPEGWLEIQARSDGPRLGVRAGLDADDLAGAPVTAIVSARAFGQGKLSARIGGAGAGNTVTVASGGLDEHREKVATGRWETLVVRLEQAQLVGDRLAIIVELDNARAGDHLDIGRVELFAGRYP